MPEQPIVGVSVRGERDVAERARERHSRKVRLFDQALEHLLELRRFAVQRDAPRVAIATAPRRTEKPGYRAP